MLITLLVLAAAISKSAISKFTFNKFDTKKGVTTLQICKNPVA
jgi:hypothetical protein